MPAFRVTIHHFRKPACLNPEEPTTKKALHSLGFTQIDNIQMGGCFVIRVNDVADRATAEKVAIDACDKLLVNPVTNIYAVDEVEEVSE